MVDTVWWSKGQAPFFVWGPILRMLHGSALWPAQVAVNAHSPRHFSLRISPRIGDEQPPG